MGSKIPSQAVQNKDTELHMTGHKKMGTKQNPNQAVPVVFCGLVCDYNDSSREGGGTFCHIQGGPWLAWVSGKVPSLGLGGVESNKINWYQ